MDNATAEYAFINAFFASEPRHSKDAGGPMSPPILSPIKGEFDEPRSAATSEIGGSETMSPRRRVMSITSVLGGAPNTPGAEGGPSSKEEQAALNQIWKQVMDPVLTYCEVSPGCFSRLLINMLILRRHSSRKCSRHTLQSHY